MTHSQILSLDIQHLTVESKHFPDVMYAVDKERKGIRVLYGDKYSKELPIDAENVLDFVAELWEVWNHLK